MFSYFGTKRRLITKYPDPKHKLIIEPFAGAAAYALRHWRNDVILIDSYEPLIKLWKYLQQVQPKDILALPLVANGEKIPTYLAEEEQYLLGYCCNNASAYPKHVAGRMNFNSWHRDMGRIADDLHKIRHWQIRLGNYDEIRNVPATWFVDPPYQVGGKYYPKHDIDYSALADWCINRVGQVIVCERQGADWLPFTHLAPAFGQRYLYNEVVWYKD